MSKNNKVSKTDKDGNQSTTYTMPASPAGLSKGKWIRKTANRLMNLSKMAEGEVFEGTLVRVEQSRSKKYKSPVLIFDKGGEEIPVAGQAVLLSSLDIGEDLQTPNIGKPVGIIYKGKSETGGRGNKGFHRFDVFVGA